MDSGLLNNGLRWSVYSTNSSKSTSFEETLQKIDNNIDFKYHIMTYLASINNNGKRAEEVSQLQDNCDYDTVSTLGAEDVMSAQNLMNYESAAGPVNDFDISVEGCEAVPVVYLSTSRAARLQRALRLAGYKKVCKRKPLGLNQSTHLTRTFLSRLY